MKIELWFTSIPWFCSSDPLSHASKLTVFHLLVLNTPLLLQFPAMPGYFKSLDVLYFDQLKILPLRM